MKKIYLTAMAGILMMLSSQIVSAQNEGCQGVPRATYYNIEGNCVVFIQNMPGNTVVALVDLNLAVVGSATTDPSGFAAISFPCDKIPFRVAAVSGPSCSAIVPPQATLPVKLTSFTAKVNTDNSVALNWVSSLELSSYKYVVQKSYDGLNFSDIGSVNAAGNSVTSLSYGFTDKNFTSGAAFFRLKQVDIDGKTEYSKIAYVNSKAGLGLVTKVFPNPFTTDVQLIGISSAELNSKNVQVYNSFGQNIRYRLSGANAIEIDATAPKGVYVLKVKSQTFKLVKN